MNLLHTYHMFITDYHCSLGGHQQNSMHLTRVLWNCVPDGTSAVVLLRWRKWTSSHFLWGRPRGSRERSSTDTNRTAVSEPKHRVCEGIQAILLSLFIWCLWQKWSCGTAFISGLCSSSNWHLRWRNTKCNCIVGFRPLSTMWDVSSQ